MKIHEPPPYESIFDLVKSIGSQEVKRLTTFQKHVEEKSDHVDRSMVVAPVEKQRKPGNVEMTKNTQKAATRVRTEVEKPTIREHDIDLLT